VEIALVDTSFLFAYYNSEKKKPFPSHGQNSADIWINNGVLPIVPPWSSWKRTA